MPLNRLFMYMYVMKTVCHGSLPSLLTWVSLKIFYLDQCQMEMSVQLSIIVIGRRDKVTACGACRVIEAVELHVNATYYT